VVGGDGSTPTRVARSCLTALDFFNVTDRKVFVNRDINQSAALLVQCLHGASLGGNGSSVESSSVSCAVLWTHWGLTNGTFYVNGAQVYVIIVVVSLVPMTSRLCRFASCQAVIDDDTSARSGVYKLIRSGAEYPTWCEMINGKGWALVLRAEGTETTFGFESTHWTTNSTINVPGYASGTSDSSTEYKSPLFSVYPYSELRLGMRVNGTTNWLEVKHGQYASMLAAMNGGQVTFNTTTRNDWLALANNGALQPDCNQIGYNFVPPPEWAETFHLRIGIVANYEECDTPDSFVGFGSKRMTLPFELNSSLSQCRI
jgi:hypothetical protein